MSLLLCVISPAHYRFGVWAVELHYEPHLVINLIILQDVNMRVKVFLAPCRATYACHVTGNCMDEGWLSVYNYTPSGPEGLQVSIETRQDETGHLHPVLVANWNIRDDGKLIGHLRCYLLKMQLFRKQGKSPFNDWCISDEEFIFI